MAIHRGDDFNPEECVERIGLPLVVKPVASGSSVGISIVKSTGALKDAMESAWI